MEDNQQFIKRLRDNLSRFFKVYDEYCDDSKTISEKVKVLEDIARISYGIANELWIKTAPPEEETLAKNIAEQILPPINLEKVMESEVV